MALDTLCASAERSGVNKRVRQAACAIPLRTNAAGELEVLLLRRAPQLSFLGGFHAFPGGTVDRADAALCPHADGPRRSAALRELFEETGILVAAPLPGEQQRRALRAQLEVSSAAWQQAVTQNELAPQWDGLIPMGHWITPPYTPVVYDATYFAVWVEPDVPIALATAEHTEALWVPPARAIERHHRGELFITYPVLETLKVMAATPHDMQAASQRMAERSSDPYPTAGGEMLDGVRVVPLRTPTLPPATHTNAYILGDQHLVVVDPGSPYPDEQTRLMTYLRHLEQTLGAQVQEIWLTHHHRDHIGGVAQLREQLGVPVAAHPKTAAALQDTLLVERTLEDGDVRQLPRQQGAPAEWVALHTPGHTAGHLCFYERTRHTLLSGDVVLGLGTVLVAPPEGNMQQYMATLERLNQLPLGFVFPAHGPPIAAGHHKIETYIAHRTMRENAILDASGTPHTPRQITRQVYVDVDPQALPLAEMNVRAHLEKLMAEGRVEQDAAGRYRRVA